MSFDIFSSFPLFFISNFCFPVFKFLIFACLHFCVFDFVFLKIVVLLRVGNPILEFGILSKYLATKTLLIFIDTLNIPTTMVDNSHFRRYSIQGPKHERSYMELMKDASGDLYAFIAVDACLQPGPTLPLNFNGFLTQKDIDHIQHLVDKAKRAGVNYAIWFSHYPTTSIVTENKENLSLKRLIAAYDASLTYLCGHFHSLAGLVPHMYSLQEDKFFELEVADWKKGRVYRVVAIDHGLLSFVDTKFGDWPIILITNPKNALFQVPSRREAKIQLGTHFIGCV